MSIILYQGDKGLKFISYNAMDYRYRLLLTKAPKVLSYSVTVDNSIYRLSRLKNNSKLTKTAWSETGFYFISNIV